MLTAFACCYMFCGSTSCKWALNIIMTCVYMAFSLHIWALWYWCQLPSILYCKDPLVSSCMSRSASCKKYARSATKFFYSLLKIMKTWNCSPAYILWLTIIATRSLSVKLNTANFMLAWRLLLYAWVKISSFNTSLFCNSVYNMNDPVC